LALKDSRLDRSRI